MLTGLTTALWDDFRKFHAALAVALELERAAKQDARRLIIP